MELKKPASFETQVQLLEEKNIIIDDKNACIDFLKQVNYYRFSAYFLPFRDPITGKCFTDISFDRIRKIYEFDQQLRALIFSAIEDIEIYIRTQLAYYHAHTYGSDGYILPSSYNERHNHVDFIKRISSCIQENEKTLVVKHHMQNYEGKFPLWVIIEFFSIGMLSHFYRGFKTQDKKRIANELYRTNYKNLESWLRCLTDLRNRCAHYSRLYYWVFPAIPRMPDGTKYVATRRLFAQLYMLKLMYPDHTKWSVNFFNPLVKLVSVYRPYISTKHLDFPYHWKSMLK